jgi:hypothetical protein
MIKKSNKNKKKIYKYIYIKKRESIWVIIFEENKNINKKFLVTFF